MLDEILTEKTGKAKSKTQQRLMGAVHAYQKDGTLPKNKSFAKMVKEIAKGGKKKKRGKGKTKGISKKSAEEYAETKHKGLPEKVSESFFGFLTEFEWDRWERKRLEARTAKRFGPRREPPRTRRSGVLRGLRRLGAPGPNTRQRAYETVAGALRYSLNEAQMTEPDQIRDHTYKNLDEYAKAVWAARDVNEKKALLHEMVDSFKFKGKQQQWRHKISTESRPDRLDYLASALTLADIAQSKVE